MGEAVAGRTEAPVRMVSRHLQAVPITPPFDSTSADLSERRDSGNAIPASSSPSTRMPVKGSTSRDVNTSSGWTVTLSDRAPTVSAADKPDSPQREGPLPNSQQVQDRAAGTAPEEPEGSTCASPPEPSASAAPPSPAPLPRLTPLHVTLFYLHALYATRLVLRATRDSIATALVANPLPPPFAPTPASASFIKRVGRMHWRIRTIKRRCGAGILAWLVTTCSLVAFLSQASSGSAGALGWNAVACPAYVVDLRLAEGLGGVDAGARGWKPFRNVILLEVSLHSPDSPLRVCNPHIMVRVAPRHSRSVSPRYHAPPRQPRLDARLCLDFLPPAPNDYAFLASASTLVPPTDRQFPVNHRLALCNEPLHDSPSPPARPRQVALAPLAQLLDPRRAQRYPLAARKARGRARQEGDRGPAGLQACDGVPSARSSGRRGDSRCADRGDMSYLLRRRFRARVDGGWAQEGHLQHGVRVALRTLVCVYFISLGTSAELTNASSTQSTPPVWPAGSRSSQPVRPATVPHSTRLLSRLPRPSLSRLQQRQEAATSARSSHSNFPLPEARGSATRRTSILARRQ